MSGTATALSSLKQQRPEWRPWIDVVEEALRDVDVDRWEAAVPADANGHQVRSPRLAGASVTLETRAAHRLLQRLIHIAARTGTPQMKTLRRVLDARPDVVSLFKASLCQHREAIRDAASSCGADAQAFEALMGLFCVPFLQACNRRWHASMPPSWVECYCPVCGAMPAFAETRGIERSRFFRCGRCGSEWHARLLRCPYCGMDHHTQLVSLVPEHEDLNAVIEGCRSCRGYLKTFTRLQGCPPSAVMLDDLASVHLDLAAVEQGYIRSAGTGYEIDVTVTGAGKARRFFGRNA
jgi:FdhE protein